MSSKRRPLFGQPASKSVMSAASIGDVMDGPCGARTLPTAADPHQKRMDDMVAKSLPNATSRKQANKAGGEALLTISRPEMLVEGSDHRFRRLVHSLLAFLARHQAVREGHAAVIGLAGVEYTVLISIRHLAAESDVHVRAVADHLHLSGAFVTTITNKLMQKGLIEKAAHPTDRRRLSLKVTKSGSDLLNRLAPRQSKVNDVQFDCLSASEFPVLLDMVERLVDSSDRAVALQRYLADLEARATPLASVQSRKEKTRYKR
jgi:DNA-binding MarR family transcriptional regulator